MARRPAGEPAPVRLRGPDDVARFVGRVAGCGSPFGALVFGIAMSGRVTGITPLPRPFGHASISVEALASASLAVMCPRIVLCWFEQAGCPVPSRLEVEAFLRLADDAVCARVLLVDAIVVAGHRWWSLRELAEQFS